MDPNTLIAYDDAKRPRVLPVCGLHGLTESTVISWLIFSSAACESPPQSQDVEFTTVQPVFRGLLDSIGGQIVGRIFCCEAVSGARHTHRCLENSPLFGRELSI